jgi:hypothetical protein
MRIILFALTLLPLLAHALTVGIGKADITPPVGTPSAGYMERKGEGMEGAHDPLLAIALYIDNGEKKIALCSVDNLGFDYGMVQAVARYVHTCEGLENCEVYVGSSHTHSGGGSYLNIPAIGAALAGTYNSKLVDFYVEKTAEAIIKASQQAIEGKIGIGYGFADKLSKFRSTWPEDAAPLADVAVIKVERDDGTPYAVLFNYAMHPTVLRGKNRLFSADFIGYARDHIQTLLGKDIQPIYFNGAQGDIAPQVENNQFETCDAIGKSLAVTVQKIWESTMVQETLSISTDKWAYDFAPQATPAGMKLPVDRYLTEMNLILFNKTDAFLTMPGELSSVYDARLKQKGKELGLEHVSILGLTNDAHGYIILPEAWRKKTFESNLSFGGENYGDLIENRAVSLLEASVK